MEKEHIYLIGFMGVGKSCIARTLSQKLQLPQLEMDEILEQEQNMSISEIFKSYGEEHFRDLETELLRRIHSDSAAVVSCGGGAVLREENIALMKSSGHIILLTASPEQILMRVQGKTTRPILNGHMNVPYIQELMDKRQPLYQKAADFQISTDDRTPEEICGDILRIIGRQ